jgi:hypothetical protein
MTDVPADDEEDSDIEAARRESAREEFLQEKFAKGKVMYSRDLVTGDFSEIPYISEEPGD